MSNYTRPHDKNYKDNPEDFFFLAMVFSQALDAILEDGHGVLIDIKGDALKVRPEAKRVVIFNDGNMMRVINAEERTDLEHGDRILMIDGNSLNN